MNIRALMLVVLCFVVAAAASHGQDSDRLERLMGIPARIPPVAPLPAPQGFQNHIVDGKLVLSLDDSIRLAMVNNTDIHIDQAAVDLAANTVHRRFAPFDPVANASFLDQRIETQASSQLQGATFLNILNQTAQFGYAQTFATGTNFQTEFIDAKQSTNSVFFLFNPSYATSWSFQVTQPLLKNFGVFANKAPIYIAQRNLKQSQATFEGEVNDILLTVISRYWNVVLARESLEVQRKSYEEAQQSYERDKKALRLGALPPLDIYRSESEVAARRVTVIQSEYTLKQAEDQFRQVIAADRDPALSAIDLNLTEKAEPPETLADMDIATALSLAVANRPELEALHQQLAADEIGIRLAHNNLRPDLELVGVYSPTGLGGNLYNIDTIPPTLISTGGLSDSLSQLFAFKYPTYSASLTLTLPLKNHAAEADLADAVVSQKNDQYREARTIQSITLEVKDAVHLLEQAKLSLEAAKVSEDLARKSLQAEQRKYQLGGSTVFFVLDAQTQLANAEFALAQAQTNYQTAVAAVDHATGKLLEHHQVQITSHK
ncbi:MAG: TolC family protein [Candidatus Acidiferrum sp.]